MPAAPTLSPQVLGRAENAHKPLMDRILAQTGTTFHQWVALNLARGGGVDSDQLIGRMTGALKIADAAAAEALAGLTAAGLLRSRPGAGLGLTPAGQDRYDQIRADVDQVMSRVYGDIPAEDLATAGRVLATITARANAEAAGQGG